MSTNIARKKDRGLPGNGGEFTTPERFADDTVSLDVSEKHPQYYNLVRASKAALGQRGRRGVDYWEQWVTKDNSWKEEWARKEEPTVSPYTLNRELTKILAKEGIKSDAEDLNHLVDGAALDEDIWQELDGGMIDVEDALSAQEIRQYQGRWAINDGAKEEFRNYLADLVVKDYESRGLDNGAAANAFNTWFADVEDTYY